MVEQPKRYRAFISYSQRDKPIARRIHRALETYRVPKGIDARVERNRTLGRFFRDDEEMGASRSLGAALTGALDDSDSLIVICSPAAAKSTWVDAEIRRFKSRADPRVFAVIAAGAANDPDPARECFPPSLKVKIDANGSATSEPDEPRAPDLQRDGLTRVRAELAASLLDVPFDALWQRDRRRARRTRTVAAAAALLLLGSIGAAGVGWFNARFEVQTQAARQAVANARDAIADGRVTEALTNLVPFVERRGTSEIVDGPLRTILGWVPAPSENVNATRIQPVRFRESTLLLDSGRGAYDVSDVGLRLERVIRSADGRRLVVIGDQRVLVFDVAKGERIAQAETRQVSWLGHAFEAPTGLIVVTGAVLGPTNGSVFPYVLAIASDGWAVERHQIKAHMFWGSAAGVAGKCETLLVASHDDLPDEWRVEGLALAAAGLGEPVEITRRAAKSEDLEGLAGIGRVFPTREAYMADGGANPFTASDCGSLDDHRFGVDGSGQAPVPTLDIGLAFERADRWTRVARREVTTPKGRKYEPQCTAAKPCPIVGGDGETYNREDASFNVKGPSAPPRPRWLSQAATDKLIEGDAIFFDHNEFNSGHLLTICRRLETGDACFQRSVLGEDHRSLDFLRSLDGRYLYWPFGGMVLDLVSLKPLTAARAIPQPPGLHFDFEFDRAGLTLAEDSRLVTFLPTAAGDAWVTTGSDRASEPFGLLSGETREITNLQDAQGRPYRVENPTAESPLYTLASLGGRQYLAVRRDGVLARLDAATSQEIWRVTAAGLGRIEDVQLNQPRRHALVMGSRAWRLFRLEDGFALSGLLAPPTVVEGTADLSKCRLNDVPGLDGEITATCGDAAFSWRPRLYQGEVASRLALVRCADESVSALDAVRRCFSNR